MTKVTAIGLQETQKRYEFFESESIKKEKLVKHMNESVTSIKLQIDSLNETLRIRIIKMDAELSATRSTTEALLSDAHVLKNQLASEKEKCVRDQKLYQSVINDKAALNKTLKDIEVARLKQKDEYTSQVLMISNQRKILVQETDSSRSLISKEKRELDSNNEHQIKLLNDKNKIIDGRINRLVASESESEKKAIIAQNTITKYQGLLSHHKGLIINTELERKKVEDDQVKVREERAAVASEAIAQAKRKTELDTRHNFMDDREKELLAYKGELAKQTSRAKEEAIKKKVTWDDNLKL